MTAAALRALALAACGIIAAGVLAAALGEPARMDFVAQYAAARLVLGGRAAEIVDPAAILAAEHAAAPARTGLLPFVQVPAVAVLLAPLAALPFEAAFAVAAAIDALLVASSLALLGAHRAPWSAALLLLAPPAVLAVAHAQISPLVLLLVAAALRSGPRASGLALGLSLLRPQTAPLLVLGGLVDRRRRWWTAGGALVVAVVSVLAVGPVGTLRYAAQLVDASAWSVTGERGLGTSIGWAGPLIAAGAGWLGIVLAGLSLVGGAVAVVRAPEGERPRAAALWSIVAAPHVLIHDAVLAYPAVVALATRRAAWDVASVVAWIAHVAVAPVAVVWSLVLAAATWRRTRVPSRST